MNNPVKTDDVIFNFFKQICDEKDDKKCVELGNDWINAMETNLVKMEENLEEKDFLMRHKVDVETNMIKNCDHNIPIEASSIALNYIKKNLYI